MAAEFSKMSGGCAAGCWGEWLPADCERSDVREKGVYSSYTPGLTGGKTQLLSMTGENSQVPDALRAERLRESLSLLAGIVKIGC